MIDLSIGEVANVLGAPWELSFSFGRGLQALPLKAWKGETSNFAVAQRVYYDRARVTELAEIFAPQNGFALFRSWP